VVQRKVQQDIYEYFIIQDFAQIAIFRPGRTFTFVGFKKQNWIEAGLKYENTAVGIRHADYVVPYIRKSWH
jgi:hypothetical protein